MNKITLALAGALLAIAASAHAQTSAPSTRYFLGPSIGEQWAPSSTYVGGFNAQVGTTYTVLRSDMGKIVSFTNAAAIAVTLPVATTVGFEAGKCFVAVAAGAGDATITPTTSTINGAATLVITHAIAGARVCSDGTNYFAF